MRRVLSVFVAGLLLFGIAVAMPADAKRRPKPFQFVPSAELGFDGGNTAKLDTDPLSPRNQVISIDSDPENISASTQRAGAIFTDFGRVGPKVKQFEDKLSLHYLLIDRQCIGGAPRFSLAVDTDGDRQADGNAWAYVGGDTGGAGPCPEDFWVFEDMTDLSTRWDLSQLGGPAVTEWENVKALHGDARVLSVTLADDAAWNAAAQGCLYVDDVEVANRVLRGSGQIRGTGADQASANDC